MRFNAASQDIPGESEKATYKEAAFDLNLLLRGRRRRARSLLWGSGRLRFLLAFSFLAGRQDRMQDRAFHAGHELDNRNLADVLDESVDDVVAEVAMSHLTSAEAETGFDLVAALEKLDCLILLRLIVVVVDGDGELDFLDDDDFLLFARGAFGLVLLVEEAAVVLNAADGWDGGG